MPTQPLHIAEQFRATMREVDAMRELPTIDESQENRLAFLRHQVDAKVFLDLINIARLAKANDACLALLVRVEKRAAAGLQGGS